MHLDRYSTKNYSPEASVLKQIFWYFCGYPLVRSYWLPFSNLKVFILRKFGAKIGKGVRLKPGIKIKFPWKLIIEDYVWIGENTWIDNLALVTIESHVCISQDVYLCTGNHDWTDPDFQLQIGEIYLETGSWIAARAVIGPNVRIGKGAVLAIGSVTGKSLEPMTIYLGNPARAIKVRKMKNQN